MKRDNKVKEKAKVRSTLLKIVVCVLAMAFTSIAAMLDNPWLCAPAILILAIGVMLDD